MMSCGLPLPAFFARSNAVEELVHVVAVDGLDVVAERLEALRRVLALRRLGHRVERDGVGVVDEDEVVELLVPGELHRLERDAFLHAAVAGEADDVMVEDRVLRRVEARLGHLRGDGHADGVRDALAERAGGRLDAARGVRELGVAGRLRAELAEALHLVERHVRVAAEVQPRVEEHRAVAGGEHEAVAVRATPGARASGAAGRRRAPRRSPRSRAAGRGGRSGWRGRRRWRGRGRRWRPGRGRSWRECSWAGAGRLTAIPPGGGRKVTPPRGPGPSLSGPSSGPPGRRPQWGRASGRPASVRARAAGWA